MKAFATADSWIVVGGATQPNWLRLIDALEAPALAADPRFREIKDRMANLAVLQETKPGPGRVQLQLYVDQSQGRLLAYGVRGDLLAELNVAAPDSLVVAAEYLEVVIATA